MSLGLFDRGEIKNYILGVAVASAKTAKAARYSDAELLSYQQGFFDALESLALSVGIADLSFDALPAPRPAITSGQVVERRR